MMSLPEIVILAFCDASLLYFLARAIWAVDHLRKRGDYLQKSLTDADDCNAALEHHVKAVEWDKKLLDVECSELRNGKALLEQRIRECVKLPPEIGIGGLFREIQVRIDGVRAGSVSAAKVHHLYEDDPSGDLKLRETRIDGLSIDLTDFRPDPHSNFFRKMLESFSSGWHRW